MTAEPRWDRRGDVHVHGVMFGVTGAALEAGLPAAAAPERACGRGGTDDHDRRARDCGYGRILRRRGLRTSNHDSHRAVEEQEGDYTRHRCRVRRLATDPPRGSLAGRPQDGSRFRTPSLKGSRVPLGHGDHRPRHVAGFLDKCGDDRVRRSPPVTAPLATSHALGTWPPKGRDAGMLLSGFTNSMRRPSLRP